MTTNTVLAEKAQAIVDMFFENGAIVTKENYDIVLNALTQTAQQERTRIVTLIKEMVSNSLTDVDSVGTYRLGYEKALFDLISEITK